ncbi:hypothetical protein K8R14_03840 [bacterium]|nr:hypothetical protein [bacterium]
MKKYLFTILLLLLIPSTIFAEDEISVDDILGNTDNVDVEQVEQDEEERLEEIENELNILIPDYTDNPSHIITFVDPSEEKAGVELDIDEKGFEDITSPYSLPSLGIGEHHLKFRFVDSLGSTKLLEYDTIIIPRPPIVKAPTFENNTLHISGTGFANSEVIVTLSVNASNFVEITAIDSEGNWNTSINLDTVVDGIYTVFAYTRKDGYASNPSESAVLAYGDVETSTISENHNGISFAFNNISLEDIPTILGQNTDLIVTFVGFLLLGSSISAILITLLKKKEEGKVSKAFSKKMNNTTNKTKEKTLLEIFSDDGTKSTKTSKKPKKRSLFIKKKEKQTKRKTKRKTTKKGNTISKEDFLKDFKKFDPDTDKGKESRGPSKKDKKEILISLTSKKPNK